MTELPSYADICIVGAGPSGLSLAIALRQAGYDPLILERQRTPATTSRAAVVHARTLEVLEALDVTPRLLAEGIRVPIFRVRDRDRVLMKADFSSLDTAYPFTLMCPQDRTEAILRARLQEVGGRIRNGVEVVSVTDGPTGAAVNTHCDGTACDIDAGWVVGCDGGHSIARQGAGIAFQGDRYAQSFILADVQMDWPLPRQEVSLFFSPGGLVVVAPLPQNRFRIVATVDRAPEQPEVAFVERLLAERGPTGDDARIRSMVWSSRFHVAHRLADRFVASRVALCGDAAHVHSPAGGQGMNTGIQDAITLAAPLMDAMRNGEASALSSWAQERHRIARDVVATTDRMTRAATLKSGALRLARNTMLTLAGHLPGVSGSLAHRLAELDRRTPMP